MLLTERTIANQLVASRTSGLKDAVRWCPDAGNDFY
jgi:hypothetical protein